VARSSRASSQRGSVGEEAQERRLCRVRLSSDDTGECGDDEKYFEGLDLAEVDDGVSWVLDFVGEKVGWKNGLLLAKFLDDEDCLCTSTSISFEREELSSSKRSDGEGK